MPTSGASRFEVILDKSQRSEKYSSADFVIHAGIPTKIDAKHAIAHNKIMVIDDQTVITGSFNFTTAAEEHNAENLLVIRSPDLAAKYTANWQAHAAHSDPYEGKTQGYSETHRAAAEPRRPTPLLHLLADSWPRQDRRSSTGPIASRRPRFPRRTSCITPRGTRRSRLGRSRVRSATRRILRWEWTFTAEIQTRLLENIFVPMSGLGVRSTH